MHDEQINHVDTGLQLQDISTLFNSHLLAKYDIDIPEDYLLLVAKAMVQLKLNQRTNVLYNLVRLLFCSYTVSLSIPYYIGKRDGYSYKGWMRHRAANEAYADGAY